MRKWLSVIFALVMTLMCGMTMVLPAYAAESPEVSVPVTISVSGTRPRPAEIYKVVLKADDAAYPMPEGAIAGMYTLSITGPDTKSFPGITYDRVGIYTYTVYQLPGTNRKCTYDDTVYSLVVTITNNADYTGLEATAVLYPDSEGEKQPGAEFTNKYKVDPPSNVPKTGDEASPLLYAVLIAVGVAMIAALFLTRKSKKSEE